MKKDEKEDSGGCGSDIKRSTYMDIANKAIHYFIL